MAAWTRRGSLSVGVQPDDPGADGVGVAGVALPAKRRNAAGNAGWPSVVSGAVARGTVLGMVKGRFGCTPCTP